MIVKVSGGGTKLPPETCSQEASLATGFLAVYH